VVGINIHHQKFVIYVAKKAKTKACSELVVYVKDLFIEIGHIQKKIV
jgi:hypothetical protein